MKPYSIVFIGLLVICGISDIHCGENHKCYSEFQECTLNEQCCEQNCEDVNSTYAVCYGGYHVSSLLLNVNDICSIAESVNDKFSKALNKKYGYNAAHAHLPENTTLTVEYNGNSLNVTVNGEKPSGNLTLELSKEAAAKLHIKGVVPCSIKLHNQTMIESIAYNIIVSWIKPFACVGVVAMAYTLLNIIHNL